MSIHVRTLTGIWGFGARPAAGPEVRRVTSRKFDAGWRAARRHSRMVSVLRIALPAICVVVVASMFISVRTVSTSIGNIDLGEVGLEGTTLTMKNPSLSGFNENGTSYQVTAVKALQDVTNPRVVTLEQIDGTMTNPDGNDVQISAQNGVYDADAQKLDLSNDIVVLTEAGERAYLNSAHVDMEAGMISSDSPVRAETKSARIAANGMEITDRGSHLLFTGGVVVELRLDGGKLGGKPRTPRQVDEIGELLTGQTGVTGPGGAVEAVSVDDATGEGGTGRDAD
jgi:lipopolysaccharide export system protein LptC